MATEGFTAYGAEDNSGNARRNSPLWTSCEGNSLEALETEVKSWRSSFSLVHFCISKSAEEVKNVNRHK